MKWFALLIAFALVAGFEFGPTLGRLKTKADAAAWVESQHRKVFDVCRDPNNYGVHDKGCREGMCLGYAINLMYRLQHEAPGVTAEVWVVDSFSDLQPTAPQDDPSPSGSSESPGWAHAFVVFWTWWDNRMYAVDQNVGFAVPIDINMIDWTCGGMENSAVAKEIFHQLWSHLITRYPFAFDNVDFMEPMILRDKREVLNYFDPEAKGYFEMQDHAYYFPPDWCVD